jgi:hypothetical protein
MLDPKALIWSIVGDMSIMKERRIFTPKPECLSLQGRHIRAGLLLVLDLWNGANCFLVKEYSKIIELDVL